MEKKEDDYTASFCPSFSSYTGDRIAETAERVRLEFSGESNDDEFEFVNLRSNCETVSSSSSDCDFVFPIFNQILSSAVKSEASSIETITTQLRDLFLRDPEDRCSSSSSDEEGIRSEIHCPWTPEKSPNGGWRKSKSTGTSSSRRWRIKDLLKRSYSERKQSFNFLNSNSTNRERSRDESSKKMKKDKVSSAHEKFYLKKKAMKEEEKRKSYLPYKKDLFGIFFNIHRYGKNSSSFLI